MAMSNLNIQNASLSYGEKIIFSNINLHLPSGKWTALLGLSGAGKSSLLRFIAGLKTPQASLQGSVSTDNHLPVNEQIAYMAQTDLLLPWLNVLENAMLSLKLSPKNNAAALLEKAKSLLSDAGLKDKVHLYPHELSGGMRQRVALVRTLMEDKPIILMDEPFSALDAITRYKLQELAANLLKNKTVLFITHDIHEALRLAHEIIIMQHQPVFLKSAASLTTPIPRKISDTEFLTLQNLLMNELMI